MKVNGLFKDTLQDGTEVLVKREHYASNGNVCFQAYYIVDDGELFLLPFTTLTVNFDDLKRDEIAIDIENFPEGLTFLLKNNIIEGPHRIISSGFCVYPVSRIKQEILSMSNKEFEL